MEKQKLIYVIEDDEEIRQAFCEILTGAGFRVRAAVNGRIAMAALESTEPPAMIFLDVMMPAMDGLEFLERLRNNLALAKLPVIAISAASLSEVKGATMFMRKPMMMKDIIDVARAHCA